MNFSADRENFGFFDKSPIQQPKLERCYGVVAPLQDFIVVRLITLQLCQNSIYNCSFNVSLLETLQGSRLLFHNDIQVIYFLLAVTAFVTRASPWRLHSAYSATIIIEIIIMIINSSKSWGGPANRQTNTNDNAGLTFFPVIRPNLRVATNCKVIYLDELLQSSLKSRNTATNQTRKKRTADIF